MKKIFLSLFILVSFTASAQWTIINGNQRFVKGFGIPTHDTTYSASLADSSQIVLRPQDTSLYIKYKDRWRKVGVNTGAAGTQDLQSVLNIGNYSYNKDLNIYGRTSNNQVYISALDNYWMPFMGLFDSVGGALASYTYPQATIEFQNKYMSQKLRGQDSTRAIVYLPTQTTDATDTLATLANVRAGGGNQNLQSVLNNGSVTYDGQIIDLRDTTDGNNFETYIAPSGLFTNNNFRQMIWGGAYDMTFSEIYGGDTSFLSTNLRRNRSSYDNDVYLPSNRINTTDTLATLADVRAGGGSQDLESVLANGHIAHNDIDLYSPTNSGNEFYISPNDNDNMPFLGMKDSLGRYIELATNNPRIFFQTKGRQQNLIYTDSSQGNLYLPYQNGATDTLATLGDIRTNKTDTTSLSNRINLKLNILDTANKWVNNITRTVGKDSIIFYIGSNRYAIKDSVGTNPPASGYYGAFSDNTSQTAASINTAYAVKLNTTDLTNGVSVVNDGSGNPTKIRLANTGIYNIQFSLQFEKTGGSGNMIADIWIRKNGVDIPSTTGKVVLTGSANASPIIAAWNYVLDLAAGDSIQLMWATSNTNVEIIAAAASSPHPAIPSAILTVTQQAGILAGTGITAINSLTGAAQTMVVDSSNTTFKITSTGTTHTFNIPNASASGVTRGLISNTQYTTFNSKIGSGDTASMLSPYLRKVDTATLSNRINLKLNISDTASMLSPYARTTSLTSYLQKSDSTTYQTKYRSDTSRTNIYSGISSKLNTSDSSTYYSKYRSDTSRTNIYSGISSKLTASDTSVFQRKSLPSYTFIANNTTGTANGTTQTFKDSGQKVYSGSITWFGTTAPSGTTNHSYRWSQVGKLVTLRITLIYSVAGVASQSVVCSLPTDLPTPEIPTGSSANGSFLYEGSGTLSTAITTGGMTSAINGGISELKINSGGTGYEVQIYRTAGAYLTARATIQYYAQ